MKRIAFLTLALASIFLIAPHAFAAVAGSPYYQAITATNPANYYPLTEAFGSDPTLVTAANVGSVGVSGSYIGITPYTSAGFNTSLTATDGLTSNYNNTSFIGANVGPSFWPNQFNVLYTGSGYAATAVDSNSRASIPITLIVGPRATAQRASTASSRRISKGQSTWGTTLSLRATRQPAP